tara:strand:+ start:378 stop:521 length:144 start_codon:yes stop_codon:yes gene_type:complete
MIIKYIIKKIRRSGTSEPKVDPKPPDPVACANAGDANMLKPFKFFKK